MFLNRDQVIIHIDIDMFFCSVELILNPKLPRNKPIVICHDEDNTNHGIVIACNYVSREIGIKTAMPMFKANELARVNNKTLLFVKAHYNKYYLYTNKFVKLIKEFGKNVELMSVDELFLDISSKWKRHDSIHEYCQLILNSIKNRLGLNCKIGVSFTKYLAKLATNHIKKRNTGPKIFIIHHNNHLQFLRQLKSIEIHNVGPATAKPLIGLGIKNAHDLIMFKHGEILKKLIGKRYQSLVNDLLGITQTKIDKNHGDKFQSMSISKTLVKAVSRRAKISEMMMSLFDHLFKKLNTVQNVTKLVQIYVKYLKAVNNFASFQKTLREYTNSREIISKTITELLKKCKNEPIIGYGLKLGKLIDVKKNDRYLPLMKNIIQDKKIYKIINLINNDLDICFVTTVFEFKNRKNLFQDKFIFRRTLEMNND